MFNKRRVSGKLNEQCLAILAQSVNQIVDRVNIQGVAMDQKALRLIAEERFEALEDHLRLEKKS